MGARILVQPTLAFLKLYIGKRYFLDGWAGYLAARTHAFYVFLKYAKILEAAAAHRARSRTISRHRANYHPVVA